MNLFQFYWKYYTHLKYSVKKVMMMEPVIILFPGRPHHTALNTWIIFRVHFLNVHKLPLSLTKLFGAWKLQTHFVLMHACLERTTFFSLLINFILPKSWILCFNIKLFSPVKYPRTVSKCIFMYSSCLNNCQKDGSAAV